MTPLVVPDLVCLVLCAAAAVTDVRSRRIPNLLTAGGVLAGLALNPLLMGLARGSTGARAALVSAALGCLVLLTVFGLMSVLNLLGMGDVKLMAAVGALLRWPAALRALVFVALAGGAVAVAYAVARGELGRVLLNVATLGRRGRRPGDPRTHLDTHGIPYGLAILLGVLWAVGARYWPALRMV